MSLAALLVFAMAGSEPAALVPAPETAPQLPAAAAKPEEKKICFERTMIGSNLPRKVCRTAEQLKRERKRGPQVVDPAIVTSVAESGEGPN